MAFKLSAYLFLRNDLRYMLKPHDSRLRKEDKPQLKTIIDELDELRDLSDWVDDNSFVVGPNSSMPSVAVPIQSRAIERSKDKRR